MARNSRMLRANKEKRRKTMKKERRIDDTAWVWKWDYQEMVGRNTLALMKENYNITRKHEQKLRKWRTRFRGRGSGAKPSRGMEGRTGLGKGETATGIRMQVQRRKVQVHSKLLVSRYNVQLH
ncbi:uncharacterized protein SPSK_10541 [Sporothrix schenckii 1099-18]|uniref:Uncharacterized protein n=1 Tax=Sporothrix schenckii 1099-18 TaxID=1397361 RepID=A0A0F2M0J5_SPOSC|nr:uncharacterized protein SPSK_10541 [Sporothrix schenckii 1099-18]KJR82594.1 hypothetical protein SPSK_10541 [Sporothrix schenckii 1099-18]